MEVTLQQSFCSLGYWQDFYFERAIEREWEKEAICPY